MKAPKYNPIAMGNPKYANAYAKQLKKYLKWANEGENTKHICFEASHIECSCKDKCLRNINNY